MKIIKIVFLISLFNFLVVGAIVMAMQGKVTKTTLVAGVIPTVIPTTEPAVITVVPTPKPTKKIIPIAKTNTIDPFAIIFSQKEAPKQNATTIPSQGNQQVSTPVVAQPTADSRCIIVIDGTRFDVSVFRSQHSGGDIFSCGTDMSAIFHGQHPNSFLQKMAKYKV